VGAIRRRRTGCIVARMFDPPSETRIEARRRRWLIPALDLLAVGVLYAGLAACLRAFAALDTAAAPARLPGQIVAVVIAGLVVHAILIVTVHDGAHMAITRTRADAIIMNVSAGLLLVPFFAEPFRRYHLVHHAHTNEPGDPLWPRFKRDLYRGHRRVYMLAELVPLLFSILAIVFPPAQDAAGARPLAGPKLRPPLLLLSFAVAAVTAWLVRPPLAFALGTIVALNAWGAMRHWCEHLGRDRSRQSNTFSFPLGMGIGNHAAHHDFPAYSWISMALGLRGRAKDTNPWRTMVAMWRDPAFGHYEAPAPRNRGRVFT
jgi:fatty acid desaturase